MRAFNHRRAFTLAEIAFALAVVSVGVITIFLMVPQGIRAQTQVRYKVIAAAKAQEVLNILRQHQPGMSFDARDQDKEGVFPWDTRTSYRSMAPDLEPMLENLRGTVKPLPDVIARRLDSENDEIRELLDRGGRLYYFYPGLPAQGIESVRSSPMDMNWIDGSRKLVFGVVGSPQQNSILYHPSVKVGPYQDFYPSPPAHGRQSIMNAASHDRDFFHDSRRSWVQNICYDALARDAAIGPVFDAMRLFMNAVGNSETAARSGTAPGQSQAYAQAALDYALETAGLQLHDLALLPWHLRDYEQSPRPIQDGLRPPTWPRAAVPEPSEDPADFAIRRADLEARVRLHHPQLFAILGSELGLADEDPQADIWDAFFNAYDSWEEAVQGQWLWHLFFTEQLLEEDDPALYGVEQSWAIFLPNIYGLTSPNWGYFESWADELAGLSSDPIDPTDPTHEAKQRQRAMLRILYLARWEPRYLSQMRRWSQPDQWQKVLAMRYLAHAAMTFTAHHEAALKADGVFLDGTAGAQLAVSLETLRAWHESAVQMGVRHADQAGPYHWAAPRPLNRQVMMDHPLVQLDLQSPVISRSVQFAAAAGHNRYPQGYNSGMGTHFPPLVNANQVLRSQWRALYPQAIETPGLSDRPWMYPGRVLDVNADGVIDHTDLNLPHPSNPHYEAALGHARHFNLSAPFEPQERARQLVFWAVDWQSYVDFESAPSAAIDASRYPIPAPPPNQASPHSDPMTYANPYLSNTDYRRQLNGVLGTSALSNSSRNPELIYLFTAPSRQWDSATNDFSRDYSTDWYSNRNFTNDIGPLEDDIPIMSEINVWLDPRMVHMFSGHSSTSNESLWDSPGVRLLDMRSEIAQNMPVSVQNTFYGHNRNWFNMMVFLGRYGANRDGNFNGEWVNWRQTFGLSRGSSYKNVARVNQGSVPASVRMRATTVARFNFYDPRLSGGLFQ